MFLDNSKIFLLALAIFANACSLGAMGHMQENNVTKSAKTPNNIQDWKPATVRGLKIGVSTREQLLQTLGTPTSTYDSNEQSDVSKNSANAETIDVFNYSGEMSGVLQASSSKKTGVLSGIGLAPENLDLEGLIRLYGKEYVITRYRFIKCPGQEQEGSAPIEESSDGTLEYLEYREKGIIVSLDHTRKKVLSIEFVDGPRSSQCR